MLVTITKQTLLGTVAISAGTVALLVVGIERLARDTEGSQKFGSFTYIAIALGGLSVWIEMLCVYLGYSFNQRMYVKVCHPCHDLCAEEVTDVHVQRRSMMIRQRNSVEFCQKEQSSPRSKPPALPKIVESLTI